VGLARLHIMPEMLLGLLHGRYEVVAHGLPTDAQVHMCLYDETRHCLVLVVEHPTFAAVQAGRVIPILESPTVRRLEAEESEA
jgi:hypothetical protein